MMTISRPRSTILGGDPDLLRVHPGESLRVLYTGVTNDLARRVKEHKQGLIPGFTQTYRVTRLVYFEQFEDIRAAVAREKQIKGWVRARKVKLIEGGNAAWTDLAQNW